ncbi:hypothetical protein BpHYR1_033882 [Brachionus plicatilis]|uniref:Uncharacterized protein n=1 Tax=Brachionus plicatilis TaxID=10195 RepID=A0A3M7S6Q1_BRAPC|nr:hypothetical protein BpHYR1_033882 [Brachionus plicatilis]
MLTRYNFNNLASECTVRPCFKSPTIVTVMPLTVPISSRIQRLSRMFTSSIASINNRFAGHLGRLFSSAGLRVPYDHQIRIGTHHSH